MERTRYTEMLRIRIREKRRFIQVLAGPRQVGKSTIIADVLSTLKIPYVSESAGDIMVSGETWLKSNGIGPESLQSSTVKRWS